MIKLSYIFLGFILFHGLAWPLSFIRSIEQPSKGKALSFGLQTEFFRSRANYTRFQEFRVLPEGDFLQYIAFHPRISYAPFPSQYVNFELLAQSFYGSSQTLNTFYPSSAGLALSFHHKFKTISAGFELRGGFPLHKGFQNPGYMILGDGAFFAEPGLWLFIQPSRMLYFYVNTAFRWRSFLSSLVFGRLGGVFQTQNIDAGAGIDSFYPLFSDPLAQSLEQRGDLLKRVNSGSYKFYSVNPSVLSWTTWIEFKFHPVFSKVYFNLDSLGQNYAKGLTFGLVTKLKWDFKVSAIERNKENMRFDFEDDSEYDSPEEEKSYFEEKADPYSKSSVGPELKEELDSLKY